MTHWPTCSRIRLRPARPTPRDFPTSATNRSSHRSSWSATRAAITGPGSTVHRLVIRTFNTRPVARRRAADLTAADRHLVPPRTSVEVGETAVDVRRWRDGKLVSVGGDVQPDLRIATRGELAQVDDRGRGAPAKVPARAGRRDRPAAVPARRARAWRRPARPARRRRGAPSAATDSPGRSGVGAGRLRRSTTRIPGRAPRPSSTSAAADDWQQMRSIRLALAEVTAARHSAPDVGSGSAAC